MTLNGAVEQLYQEMGSRHRVRATCIQIIKTATISASQVCSRAGRVSLLLPQARLSAAAQAAAIRAAVWPGASMRACLLLLCSACWRARQAGKCVWNIG